MLGTATGSFRQDLRYASRSLAQNKTFAAVCVLTLALGIGVNILVFATFNTIVLHGLPFRDSSRLVMIWRARTGATSYKGAVSLPDALYIGSHSTSFTGVSYLKRGATVDLTGDGLFDQVGEAEVSSNLLDVLGVTPIEGRSFQPRDSQPGSSDVVVLSCSLWQQAFGASTKIIGQDIMLNYKPFKVIGILPPDFEVLGLRADVWSPLPLTPAAVRDNGDRDLSVIARLKPGVELPAVQAELNLTGNNLAKMYGADSAESGLGAGSLEEQAVGPVRPILLIFLGAVGLVLLIACSNVANLVLAKNARRERELAVRLALGAGRRRIFQLILTETVLLSLLGGCFGLAICYWGVHAVRTIGAAAIPSLHRVTMDAWVLGFTFGLSVLAGVLFGVLPALRASKLEFGASLKEGSLTSESGFRVTTGRGVQSLLTVAQVALSVVLLIGAGLLVRSLSKLMAVPIGFDPKNLFGIQFLSRVQPTPDLYFRQILNEAINVPGAKSAALVTVLPLFKLRPIGTKFAVETDRGRTVPDWVDIQKVSPGYFQTMRIPILDGRSFTAQDRKDSPCVVIINQKVALSFWPGTRAVGKRIDFNSGPSGPPSYCQIAGVVGDTRDELEAEPRLQIYRPYDQSPDMTAALVIRAVPNAPSPMGLLLDRIEAIDKTQRLLTVSSMEQIVDRSALQPRFRTFILVVFAGLALALAGIGVYGVMSYFVSQRTREFGIRIALGAQRSDVFKLVLRDSTLTVALGLALGLLASFGLSRTLQRFLYSIGPSDPVTFVVVPLLLMIVSLIAAYLPARRAMTVDPLMAIRHE
jgi:putative ABC transport system permease protein